MGLRILNLVHKELIQLRRDWLMTAFILTLPVLQLLLLAQATGEGVADLPVAVLDFDRSAASRRLSAAVENREELRVDRYPLSLDECTGLLDRGEAVLCIVVPNGLEANLAGGPSPAEVQVLADGSSTVPAGVALGAANAAVARFAAESAPQGALTPLEIRADVRYNASLRARPFTIPAQVGFIVYQVTLVIAAIGISRERELGTLESLIVSPLRRLELVVGKAIPALVIGMLNFCAMLAVAVFGFDVPFRGSLALLLGLTVVFVIAEIGYGILISGLARSQQQAILLVFVLAMVDMAFSGYLVRVRNLPPPLRQVALLVPFSHYLTIIRGVMLKGAGLDALWPQALAMLVVGLLVMAFAVRNLSRRLD